jgi:hypothetical protein
MSKQKMNVIGGIIYYICNEQPVYNKPTFPFENTEKEFNILMIDDICKLPIKDTTLIQELVVVEETLWEEISLHKCGRTGYTRVMHFSDRPLSIIPCQVVPLKEFSKTEIYKNKRDRLVKFDSEVNPDLCMKALDVGLPLSKITHVTQKIVDYAVKKYSENFNYIESNFITDELRNFIKILSQSERKKFQMKRVFLIISKGTVMKSHPEAVSLVKEILKGNEMKIDATLFSDLGACQDIFVEWLTEYSSLSDICSYSLQSIGYASSDHKKNHHWKTHLRETSKQRLNITRACCIDPKDPQTMIDFIDSEQILIKFIREMGLELKLYEANFWGRGTDVTVSDFEKEDIGESDDYVSLFVVNLDIEELDADESAESDSDSGSD